jgi:DNA-binding response OmpR family regulator
MSTVLIVEDSITQMHLIADCLQQCGISVAIANSGEEALAKIRSSRPDAIVLDIVLPGCSGFEVCREIKAAAETKDIPIVLCSTKDGEMNKFWGRRQGADAYITKPIDQEELTRTVKQLLNVSA